MSGEFWLAEESFSRTVRIEMSRSEQAFDEEPNELKGVIERATWVQKGQAHYLMYDGEWRDGEDNENTPANLADGDQPRAAQSVWKVERQQVTFIQQGFVVWTLRFHPLHLTVTTGYVGHQPIAIEVRTRHLATEIRPDGGVVDIAWEAVVGGVQQSVSLHMTFS